MNQNHYKKQLLFTLYNIYNIYNHQLNEKSGKMKGKDREPSSGSSYSGTKT